MNEQTEYSVLKILPNHGQKVLCFGHKTFYGKEEMDQKPAWHEAVFTFNVYSYQLKYEIPQNPEHSILHHSSMCELWEIVTDKTIEHVIGVTKWKNNKN